MSFFQSLLGNSTQANPVAYQLISDFDLKVN